MADMTLEAAGIQFGDMSSHSISRIGGDHESNVGFGLEKHEQLANHFLGSVFIRSWP